MKRKSRGYWTNETCKEEALKYIKRSDFKAGSGGAYNFAKDNGFLKEICSHMKEIGNRFKRLVYVYEFNDNSVYIGLTGNIGERDNKHKRDPDSAVFQHIKKTGLTPTLTYSNYTDAYKAQQLEIDTVLKYRSNGYNILNKAEPGALGGENIKWTFENCKQEALKYNTKRDFVKGNNSAYNAARRYKFLDIICAHMLVIRKSFPPNYWNKERCKYEALKYNTRNQFYKNCSGAYMSSLKNKWLDEVCQHMKRRAKKPNGHWNKLNCLKESLKYNSKVLFQKGCWSAYKAALKNGWLNEIVSHYNK